MPEDLNFSTRLAGIEALIRKVESCADPDLRLTMKELLEAVIELNSTAVNRLLEIVDEQAPDGRALIDAIGDDPLAGSVLVLYGLHPLDTAARVKRSIERLEPTLRKHDTSIEVERVESGVATLRITQEPIGHARQMVKRAIEDQIYAFAPDVTRIDGLGALGSPELVNIQTLAMSAEGKSLASANGLAVPNGTAGKEGA